MLPPTIRRGIRACLDEVRLRRAIWALLRVPVGKRPPDVALVELQRAWGNEGFVAKAEYIAEVVDQLLVTPGPILECGSGLTTLLVAALAGRRGVKGWSLEHHREWRHKVTRAARRIAPTVTVVHAPLRRYSDFEWYAPSAELPGDFRLVICDGPPGTTLGGRFGLVPVMGKSLSPTATILLDDAHRDDEQAIMARWAHAGWRVEMRGTYAVLRKS